MRPGLRIAIGLALVALGLVFLRAAWLSDDSYITLRVLDNAVSGFGLRWNVAERVQAYTHPLWLFLLWLPYLLSRETLWTVSCVGIATSLVAVALLARRLVEAQLGWRVLVLCGLLALSRSVVSYTSSGLENPLGLLLLVLLVDRCLPRLDRAGTRAEAIRVVLLGSLLALTRVDLALIGAPIVLARLRGVSMKDAALALLVGAVPLLVWEGFSLVYYGLLVPNTALAKLASGVSHAALAEQGLRYFASLGLWDPLGAGILTLGILVGLLGRARPLALGLLAYLGYIVWIGGDFMCGRFFSIPIVLATQMITEAPWGRARPVLVAALPGLLLLGDGVGPLGWLRGAGPFWTRWGIVDERVFYLPLTGLFDPRRARDLLAQPWAVEGLSLRTRPITVEPAIGIVGFYAGPSVHIVDQMALADPLLARLPMTDPSEFRIGHFARTIPKGYLETLERKRNLIEDADLARYWDAVWLVTRAELLDARRPRAIYALLTGRLEPLRQAYVARLCARAPSTR